jgi:predicted transcriptional regulator
MPLYNPSVGTQPVTSDQSDGSPSLTLPEVDEILVDVFGFTPSLAIAYPVVVERRAETYAELVEAIDRSHVTAKRAFDTFLERGLITREQHDRTYEHSPVPDSQAHDLFTTGLDEWETHAHAEVDRFVESMNIPPADPDAPLGRFEADVFAGREKPLLNEIIRSVFGVDPSAGRVYLATVVNPNQQPKKYANMLGLTNSCVRNPLLWLVDCGVVAREPAVITDISQGYQYAPALPPSDLHEPIAEYADSIRELLADFFSESPA